MKKKILSLLLVLVVFITMLPSIFAHNEGKNIYEKWGHFETDASINMVNPDSATASRAEGGANGSEFCYKLDMFTSDRGCRPRIPFPAVAGETYEISVWLKSDTKSIEACHFVMLYTNGETENLSIGNVSNAWTKHTFTWKCTGMNKNGQSVEPANLRLSFGTKTSANIQSVNYIDELSVVPRGDVEADYSSVNLGYDVMNNEREKEMHISDMGEEPVSEKVSFSDISNHWAKENIEALVRNGYVDGMGDSTYCPDDKVTRAQFIKMLVDIYSIRAPEYNNEFKDVSGDEWYVSYLVIADKLGILADELKKDGNICPEKPISREEAASIIALVAKDRGAKKNDGLSISFSDDGEISEWARKSVKDAVSYGMLKGYETGEFLPKNSITRAEAATILYRIVELSSKMEIFVDAQNGNDASDGSINNPLKTIEAARDMVAKYHDTMQNDIYVKLRGKFRLNETVVLNKEHSGGNGFSVIYTSWGTKKPVITMADEYTGWQLHDADKNIYKTFIGEGFIARQAWFNDIKGIRARSIGGLEGSEYVYQSHYLCDDESLLEYKYPQDLELVFHFQWCNPRYKVAKISEENGRVRIDLNEYFSKWNQRINVDKTLNSQRQQPSYIENAYELLDEQGEYYMNSHDGYMYYIPRSFENIETLKVKVADGEELIRMAGTPDEPITNITFDNIQFEGTSWLRVDKMGGHHDAQNNHIREGSVDVAPEAAVHIEYANNVNFTNNLFRQLGIVALKFHTGVKHSNIIGNEFYDVSGTAVYVDAVEQGGVPNVRKPETYCEYIRVNNNYIHNIGFDYKSSAAIWLGFVRHTQSNHNEICNIPYSGYNVCYGWDHNAKTGSIFYDVEVNYNYIHDVIKDRILDGAHIYSLGASSLECEKGNKEKSNRIFGNYLTQGWNCSYIYPDEGSTSWYIKDNVASADLVTNHTFTTGYVRERDLLYFIHMHSSSIKWITTENNWSDLDYAYKLNEMNQVESNVEPVLLYPDANFPEEAQEIMKNAGIEDEYKANFDLDAPKVFVTQRRIQTLEIGKPQDTQILVRGGREQQFDVADYYIDFQCEDDAVTYDQTTNTFTAHKAGIFEAEAFAVIDGELHNTYFELRCGDKLNSLDFGGDIIQLISGHSRLVVPNVVTDFGYIESVTADPNVVIDLKVEDTSVAELDDEFYLTAVGSGSTYLVGRVKYKDYEENVRIPIKIIEYSSDNTEELPYTIIDFGRENWKNAPESYNGGMKVYGNPGHSAKKYDGGLYAFDIVIEQGHSWPSIGFSDNDNMGDYKTNDCYMIGFKSNQIELQRFNAGTRTMIFGNDFNPVVGPGIAVTEDNKIIEHGKRHSVIMGAIDTEEGTRIILTIDGKNIIDYLDTGRQALDPYGHYVIYNPLPGGMVFYPFSNIQTGNNK